MRRTHFFAAAVAASLASSAPAQELGFLTGAFKNVHSVTLSIQGGDLTNKRDLATNDSRCDILNICGMAAEVLFDVTAPKDGVHLELGVGASYLRGFHEKEGSEYDIRGAVRSFPTISAYLSAEGPFVEPYAGVSFGFSDLWNAQAYNAAGTEYSIKAQTFDYGGTLGFYVPMRSLGLFFEGNYRRRRFASVDWSNDTLTDRPREFNMDVLVAAIGLQFDIREGKKQPPAFRGSWELTRVDGKELPVVDAQSRIDATTESIKTEITGGYLDLEQQGFALTFCRRAVTMSGSNTLSTTTPVCSLDSSGPYSILEEPERVELRVGPARDVVTVFRVGDEISIRRGVRVYQFRKQR